MKELTYKILDSVKQIQKSEWDALFGDITEGYEFFKTIEESNLKEFSFSYILIYEGEKIRLIAPLFSADFNLDIAVEGMVRKLIQGMRKFIPRFMILKTLFCGSPFGENGILGIRVDPETKNILIFELVKIMGAICEQKNTPFIIFKDFLKADLSILEPLKAKGFFLAGSFPSVTMELDFNSLEDYLKSLSHNTRKDLRRKMKKAQSSGLIEVKITTDIKNIIEDIYRLYLNTYNASSVKFEKLTKEFFLNIASYMPSQAKFFLYYLDGKLAAFNLCFVYKDALIDKFIGFDYEMAYKYNLYFFSWCYNIKWCIENCVRYYQVGQTDYYPKLKLGGRIVPLYAYVKHNNPIQNLILKLLAKILRPPGLYENLKSNA